MSEIAITERPRNWLAYIRAGEAFDGSLAEYTRSVGLRPKDFYSWKSILGSRGLLDEAAAQRASGFVLVIAAIAEKRVSLTPNGNVRYQLKTPYRDGTTHVISNPWTLPPCWRRWCRNRESI